MIKNGLFAIVSIFVLGFFGVPYVRAQWELTSSERCQSNCFDTMETKLFALTSSDGVIISTDSGTTWNKMGIIPQPGFYYRGLVLVDTILFAGGDNGVLRTTDYGAIWDTVSGNFSSLVYDLYTTGGNGSPIMIFAGAESGVFLSTDTGKSWVHRDSGLVSTSSHAFVGEGTNIFVGTTDGVSLSTDNGYSWVTRNNGLTAVDIATFTTMGTDLFAGTFEGGAFLSNDNGGTWDSASSGLPLPINIVSFATYGTKLFAGAAISLLVRNTNGIYMSTDSGSSWSNVGMGLSDGNILSLFVAYGFLFVANDSGIWRRPLSDFQNSAVNEQPSQSISVQSIYPNPATDILHSSVPLSSDIHVYDPIGREYSVPTTENSLDISSLPAGIYYLYDGISVKAKFLKE